MISVLTKVVGAREVSKAFGLFEDKMGDAMAAALFEEGFAIMAKSVVQCPVKTNRLRSSHYVAPPTKKYGEPIVAIGYGTTYAVPVHERTELRHKPPTKAKYLEDPLNEARTGYDRRLADRAWSNYKKGIGVKAIPRTAPARPKA